jgi:hypothetical protein
MTEDTPIACSLNGPDLRRRLADIAAIGADALVFEAEGGALRFRNEPATRARLEAVIAAESECCAFLRFELRERGDELELEIHAPEGAEPMADELARVFQAGARRSGSTGSADLPP